MDKLAQVKTYLRKPFSPLIASALALFLVLSYQSHREKRLEELERRAFFLEKKLAKAKSQAERESAILKQITESDRGFLETKLSKLTFLEDEIKKHQAYLLASPDDREHQMRLAFLKENRLRFKEGNFQKLGNLQEVEIVQQTPVEMSSEDLKQLLAQLENVSLDGHCPENPPYFIIKNFELHKKPLPSTEESFLVKCELIKQEIFP